MFSWVDKLLAKMLTKPLLRRGVKWAIGLLGAFLVAKGVAPETVQAVSEGLLALAEHFIAIVPLQ